MASGLKTTTGNHFEATYEQPWGGVASNADPEDIQPNQFVQCTGLNIKDGILAAYAFDDFITNFSGLAMGAEIWFLFSINLNVYALDDLGNTYTYVGGTFILDQSQPAAANASCIQIIQGVVYVFVFSTGTLCVYTPGASFVVGSTYVAGLYCTVLDQYLITADTNQPSDSPAIKANRVNWSSPDGFTTWDPSVDRSSGFNTLADVQDYISGVFTMGNVGFVLRSQGLTQMTPTGIGIQPFDFTPLWTSSYGIGCTYPLTFAQYGYVAIWVNDNNIYAFNSGSAPQEITGAAKTAIYADILATQRTHAASNTKTYLAGAISNQSVTKGSISHPVIPSPDLEYTLAIVNVSNSSIFSSLTVIFWTYKISTQQWTRTVKTVDTGGGNAFSLINIFFSGVYSTIGTTTSVDQTFLTLNPVLCIGYTKSTGGSPVTTTAVISKYQAGPGFGIGSPNPSPFTISFKQEDIKVGRQPQVRGVVIKAIGDPTRTSTLVVTVGNVTFTPVIVTGATKITYKSSGVFTGEDPQLTITSTDFSGVIVKAVMFGTYADGELF